jgi:hypothetical protein
VPTKVFVILRRDTAISLLFKTDAFLLKIRLCIKDLPPAYKVQHPYIPVNGVNILKIEKWENLAVGRI